MSKMSRFTGKTMTVVALALALVAYLRTPTIALSGSGLAMRFAAVDESGITCVKHEWHEMPGMRAEVTLGAPAPVLALFQGEWRGDGDLTTGRARIRLVVDGVIQPGPGDHPFPLRIFDPTLNPTIGTHGFNFISGQLNAGAHVVSIEWRTEAIGDRTCVDSRSLIVLH